MLEASFLVNVSAAEDAAETLNRNGRSKMISIHSSREHGPDIIKEESLLRSIV